MKPFTIRGIHRSAMLALRHASQLKREFNADVKTSRKGRSRSFTFKVTPQKRVMWRIIVGYPYLVNKKKQKSPDSRTMKAIYYDRTRDKVKAEKSRLRQAALHEIKKVSKSWIQDNKKHPLYSKVNVTVAQVEYDIRLIGISQFLDD